MESTGRKIVKTKNRQAKEIKEFEKEFNFEQFRVKKSVYAEDPKNATIWPEEK